MKKFILLPAVFIIAGALLFIFPSCTKPTLIGAELFENNTLNVQFTDTVTLKAFSEKPDSVVTFSANWSTSSSGDAHYGSMLLGCFKDPTFGASKAYIYTQLEPKDSVNYPANVVKVDSVAMYLPYNRAYVYGDTTQPLTLSIYRLTEGFALNAIQYSTKKYASEPQPLFTATFTPTPNIVKIGRAHV